MLRKCVYKLQVRIYVRNIYNTSHSYLSLFSPLFPVLFHKIALRGETEKGHCRYRLYNVWTGSGVEARERTKTGSVENSLL
jgi:hypothetical protein